MSRADRPRAMQRQQACRASHLDMRESAVHARLTVLRTTGAYQPEPSRIARAARWTLKWSSLWRNGLWRNGSRVRAHANNTRPRRWSCAE